jgi:hypothetical protein
VTSGGTPEVSLADLATWTAWAWLKQTTYNGAGNGFVIAKAGFTRVYIQLKNGGSTNPQFHCFLDRVTTDLDYQTAVNPTGYTKGSWGFVVFNFDDSRGTGARAKCYIGTTPDNLAEVALTVVAEGSGAYVSDQNQPLTIGGKYADTTRNYVGDIGPCGVTAGILSLAQLKSIMRGSLPSDTIAAWPMTTDQSVTTVDATGNLNDGTFTGTSASSTEAPEFSAAGRLLLLRRKAAMA